MGRKEARESVKPSEIRLEENRAHVSQIGRSVHTLESRHDLSLPTGTEPTVLRRNMAAHFKGADLI